MVLRSKRLVEQCRKERDPLTCRVEEAGPINLSIGQVLILETLACTQYLMCTAEVHRCYWITASPLGTHQVPTKCTCA
jgi:hypothetical protein